MNDSDIKLEKVIRHLYENWNTPNAGIVGCGIFDYFGNEVYATSTKDLKSNKWIHAEKNAIINYIREYGYPYDTEMVITLSPCFTTKLESRLGSSCYELNQMFGIDRVYAGAIDKRQILNGMKCEITQNRKLLTICEELEKLFLIIKQDPSNIEKIKKDSEYIFQNL